MASSTMKVVLSTMANIQMGFIAVILVSLPFLCFAEVRKCLDLTLCEAGVGIWVALKVIAAPLPIVECPLHFFLPFGFRQRDRAVGEGAF